MQIHHQDSRTRSSFSVSLHSPSMIRKSPPSFTVLFCSDFELGVHPAWGVFMCVFCSPAPLNLTMFCSSRSSHSINVWLQTCTESRLFPSRTPFNPKECSRTQQLRTHMDLIKQLIKMTPAAFVDDTLLNDRSDSWFCFSGSNETLLVAFFL